VTHLTDTFHEILGVRPQGITPLHGGCIAAVYRVDLPLDNPFHAETVVIKHDPTGQADFACEGRMLVYLATRTELPVPTVLLEGDGFLVLSWLPGESRFTDEAERHAAQAVAQLHRVTAPQFGFEEPTLIGGLQQTNPWTEGWLSFFAEHRILAMAHQAHLEGRLDARMLARLDVFCDRLSQWLEEPVRPALLHGDLWTTNMLAVGPRMTGFLDPALYYGHPEMDIAFSTLFNTFSPVFYKEYAVHASLSPDFFELRKDLYNLYPLLVHVRLFDASYLRSIERILQRVGC